MNAIYQFPTPALEPSPAAVRASCPRCADGHGTLTPLFFSDDIIDIARAKAICGKCPLTESCLRGRRNEKSRGASGAASCCSTDASSPTSGRADGRPSIPAPSSSSTSSAS